MFFRLFSQCCLLLLVYKSSSKYQERSKMSCRKKLKNQDTFLFEEDDVLPAPSVSALQKKRSVQERLTPKAGFPPRPRTSTAGNSATSSWRQVEPPALNNNYCYQPPPPPQPSTAPSTSQPSPDPALDRIVAKLRAELALSEPGARQAAAGGAGGRAGSAAGREASWTG